MSFDSDHLPARQMSGRRSKPSMDLLIDNQRILSPFTEPKKRKKPFAKIKVVDEKPPHENGKDVIENDKNIVLKMRIPKIKKPRNSSTEVIKLNESDEKQQDSCPRTLVVSLEVNKELNSNQLCKEIENKSDDDIPISEMFPDIQPVASIKSNKCNSPIQKSENSPRKKIKINELNITHRNIKKAKSKLKKTLKTEEIKLETPKSPVSVAPKTNVLSLPKIPKKQKMESLVPIESQPIMSSLLKIPKKQKSEAIPPAENILDSSHENGLSVSDSTPELKESPEENIQMEVCSSPVVIIPETVTVVEDMSKQLCINEKCSRKAISDYRWHDEFCSPDCAMDHSKQIFKSWLQKRQSDTAEKLAAII